MVPARPFLRGKPGCVRSRAALREIEPREVVEAHAQFRLVGAERVFADGEGTLEERLGLPIPALREIEAREVREGSRPRPCGGVRAPFRGWRGRVRAGPKDASACPKALAS